jgi:hypothetical protein
MAVKSFGALILHTSKLEECLKFYKTIGLKLELEEHEEGPKHYA